MTDRCTQYALDVVAGVIIAGEYVRLACQRHLDDLEKAKAAPYKYYFDVEKSEEIINFAEELTIAEGDEQENVTAYPFQCFILGSLNGWRTKEKGHRRFRTSYVQLGRQNGKSFINGILACYYGNFDGYKYGKIFCTATKQDQANIVFDEIVKFINSDEDLSEWFKVHEHNHTIDCLCTHSEIKALSGDTKSLDGHRAYLGIVDEYHAHKTNQMYKLLEGGIKKLKSALISVITTAGFDLKSPCYKLYEYCCNLLKGVFENDSQFVYIAQLDTADDLYKKENWIKANPILEYDEDALENLVPVANTARDMGGEDLRDFLVKQLNMWMQWSNALYIKDMKGNWQVFRFDYTEKKTGKRKGRPLDFMGFQFYHDKTILRESIMLSCTRKVNRVAKKEKITWYDATAILSYMGYLSNTDTYDMYLQRVKPYVNVKKLKKIVSKHSKRKEREKHERMERSVRNGGRTAGGVRHNSVTDNGISETQYQESNERGCRRKENHRMAARGA